MENIEEYVIQSIEVAEDVDLMDAFGNRKRPRRPELWKRNVQKRCRAEGKAYVNSKNQLVPERTMGEDCRCRKKCFAKLEDDEKMLIFQSFYDLGNKEMQDMYLRGLITREPVKRKRPRTGHGHQRSTSFRYILRVEDKTVEVCKQAIVSIHGITRSRLDRILALSLKYLTGPPDLRGHHNNRPRKINELILQQMHTHITSFFKPIRSKGKRTFLDGTDAHKMYQSYLEKYESGAEQRTVKYSYFYRFLVNNFNYRPDRKGRPKSKRLDTYTDIIEIDFDDDADDESYASQNEKENQDESESDSDDELDDDEHIKIFRVEKAFHEDLHEKLQTAIFSVPLSPEPIITIVEPDQQSQ